MRAARATFVLVAGAVLAVAAQVAAPIGVPIYDGVVVQEPYRYLEPGSGQDGAPTSATLRTEAVGEDGASVPFVAATQEYPPQAQLIAASGAFVAPAGTVLVVSIEPVHADAPPAGSQIAGNGYRISVTDPSGTVLAIDPLHRPTVSLRAPQDVTAAMVARAAPDGWGELPTEHGGLFGLYASEVAELGVFALVTPDTGPGLLPLAVVLGAGVVLAGIGAFVVLRRRREHLSPPEPARRPGVPSRRPSRRGRPPGRRR
ncbi:MAG: LPXTG cell wall anchor domain-containing protein [Chloroflexota bacterium]